MDIFEHAMQMEKDGENYYRETAKKIDNTGIRKILGILADEEVKHYGILSEMKNRTPDIGQTESLNNVKNIFAEMKDSGETFGPKMEQVELYQKAQQLEQKSQDFYEEKSDEVSDMAQRALLLKIADEEKRHFLILENIIQFVTMPDRYLEDAEFENIEPY
jgi:rubrerythrin